MVSKEELLKHPNYLLSKYQSEIYRQLKAFMEKNKLSQKRVAKKLGVSPAYVSQILNGDFNYTLKKLIQISLLIGKVPSIEFVSFAEYWSQQRKKKELELYARAVNSRPVSKEVETQSYTFYRVTGASPKLVGIENVSKISANQSFSNSRTLLNNLNAQNGEN